MGQQFTKKNYRVTNVSCVIQSNKLPEMYCHARNNVTKTYTRFYHEKERKEAVIQSYDHNDRNMSP